MAAPHGSELDGATQEHGLAVPGGFISHTGVAGLTLGGGFGWLSRLAGLTSDNLVAAEVVTADGRIVRASANDNEDLFWGLRGGGGNFGIVTSFEFTIHPVGPLLHLGLSFFAPEQGREMFGFARDYVRDLPDECGIFLAGLNAPPEPFVPEEYQLQPVFALAVVGFTDEEAHARLIAPIAEAVTPLFQIRHADPVRRAAADVQRVGARGASSPMRRRSISTSSATVPST